MHNLGTMRTFRTKNFSVICEAYEDQDLDLSWDEDGSTLAGLNDGTLVAFCAHVEVFYRGRSVGEDWLGSCIYRSLAEFMDHKECGKQNKVYAQQGKEGRCGSYFSDMIHEALTRARTTLTSEVKPYIRRAHERLSTKAS